MNDELIRFLENSIPSTGALGKADNPSVSTSSNTTIMGCPNFSKILSYRLDEILGQEIDVGGFFTYFLEKGIIGHLCGGVVRDLLLNQPFNDIDFTFKHHVDSLKELIIEQFGQDIIKLHSSKSGLIKLGQDPFNTIDLTMYRDPRCIRDEKRLKDVVYPLGDSLATDARNRDLSINCLYWDPKAGLQDPLGCAVDDVLARKIQVIADPKKAAIDARVSFRILLFVLRGFSLTTESEAYLSANFDRNLQTYDQPRLNKYVYNLVRGNQIVAAALYRSGLSFLSSNHSKSRFREACMLTVDGDVR